MSYAPAPRTLPPRPAAPAAGALPRVLVLAGSTASTGTSVTAAILAASVAALGHTVCLVDAGGGAQAALLGIPDDRSPGAPIAVSTTLSLTTTPPATLPTAIASACAAADVVVVDAGSQLAVARAAIDAAAATAATARDPARNPAAGLLVVTGTDAAALAAAYALVKTLAAPDLPVEAVVVGADPTAAAAAFAHLDDGAQQFLARPLRLAAAVPADPSLAVALGAGMPVHDAAAGSPAAAALQPLAARTGRPRVAAPSVPAGALSARLPAPAPGSAFAR